jgi:RNA polymerase sigma-70 factor (ECF subfamily)
MDDRINSFTALRPRLQRIALRILGSQAEARAVVDSVSARCRLQCSAPDVPVDSAAWLTSTTTCLARERWRAAERRPTAAEDSPPTPPNRIAALTQHIMIATHVALEQLEPDARLAFLLHDIFGADLAEVAPALGKSDSDCLVLIARARKVLHQSHHRQAP